MAGRIITKANFPGAINMPAALKSTGPEEIDYEAMAFELIDLIDRIECCEEGESLTSQRFDILEKYGIEIEFTGQLVSARQQ